MNSASHFHKFGMLVSEKLPRILLLSSVLFFFFSFSFSFSFIIRSIATRARARKHAPVQNREIKEETRASFEEISTRRGREILLQHLFPSFTLSYVLCKIHDVITREGIPFIPRNQFFFFFYFFSTFFSFLQRLKIKAPLIIILSIANNVLFSLINPIFHL